MKQCLGSVSSLVSEVSSAYQRTLPAGLCLHILNLKKLYLDFYFLLSVWAKSSKTADQKPAELKLPNIKEFFVQLTGLSLYFCLSVTTCPFLLARVLLFLLMLLPFWQFTFLALHASTFSLFPFWSLCLTWEEGLLMNVCSNSKTELFATIYNTEVLSKYMTTQLQKKN